MKLSWRKLLFGVLAAPSQVYALTVSSSVDGFAMANSGLVTGSGITLTTAVFAGAIGSSGTFTNGPLNLANGTILTTGAAANAIIGSSSQSKNNLFVGSPLYCGLNSFDSVILTLTVVTDTTISGLTASFIFASSEYPK
jgi:hypothetical protein